MKTTARRIVRDEKGKVLILALVLLGVGGLLMAPTLGLMSTGLTAGQVYEKKTDELYAADAGVEDAINWLVHGKPLDWGWEEVEAGQVWKRLEPLQINGKAVDTIVEALGNHDYKVSATGADAGGGTMVLSTLRAVHFIMIDGCHNYQGPEGFEVGDTYITGDASVSVNAKVKGNLIVGGDLTLTQGQTRIDGDVSVTGDITLNQGSSITGNVCTDGDLTMEQNTSITGDVLVGGDVILQNSAEIQGNVFTWGNITFANNANSRIWGNVYAYGDITIKLGNPNSRISGGVYATGSVTVIPQNRIGNISGGVHQNTDSQDWDDEPPPCPEIPVDPVGIHTYEVLGYGG